jgi:hypothetical protein
MATQIQITVRELRRAYNNGKAQGRTNFVPRMGPTYCGKEINIGFRKNSVVDYIDRQTGALLAVFQGVAYLDD